MKDIFLQDLFSNVLLAMLVMAVIAMRTQSTAPDIAALPSECRLLDNAETLQRLRMAGVVTLTDAQNAPGPVRQAVATPALFADQAGPLMLDTPARLAFVEDGCLRARLDCPAGASFERDGATLGEAFPDCDALEIGAP